MTKSTKNGSIEAYTLKPFKIEGGFTEDGLAMNSNYYETDLNKKGIPILLWHDDKPIVHLMIPENGDEKFLKITQKPNLLFLFKCGYWKEVGNVKALEMEIISPDDKIAILMTDPFTTGIPEHVKAGQRVEVVSNIRDACSSPERGFVVTVDRLVAGRVS